MWDTLISMKHAVATVSKEQMNQDIFSTFHRALAKRMSKTRRSMHNCMCSSRFFLALLSVGIVFLMTGTIISSEKDYFFDPPIDGLSMGVETDVIDLAVSAQIDKLWSAWSTLEIEKEFDPLLRESNLLLFPKPISHLRIRKNDTVRSSSDPDLTRTNTIYNRCAPPTPKNTYPFTYSMGSR